ncbi:MAG TPA: hypothetical protein VM821_06065, partial [Abditibacteriaceae bacterium]|nr:hypothetical protein [Abditibacteriaceae bacterium]
MTNTFSSTRSARFVAHRPLVVSAALTAVTVLILSGHIAQAQPLLAGQKPYRDRDERDREASTFEDDGYTERSSTRIRRTTPSTAYPAVQPMPTAQSMAQAMSQPMRSRRVAMVLPLRTGENWKAAPEFTQSFLRQMDVALRRALSNTGRFTTLEVRRFNPVLMRAVQDGVATSDDLDTLLTQPTTPNASVFLSKITFNKAPLHTFSEPAVIHSFVLENMTIADNALSVKMTGRMYSADGQTALRSLSATTTVPLGMAGADVLASASTAGTTAINRVIAEFLRTPTESEIVLGEAAPSETTTTTTTVETTEATTPGSVLPGTPIEGSSTRTPGTPATNNNGTGQPVAPIAAPGGITTVTEIPPAETFPAPAATSGDTTDATASTGTDAATLPSVDESAGSTTTDTMVGDSTTSSGAADSTSDAFPDMSSGTTSSGGATTDSPTSSSTTSDEAAASGQPLPTPTDNAATEGTTSDATTSEGTVGAMSTESHGRRAPKPIPSNEEELGF